MQCLSVKFQLIVTTCLIISLSFIIDNGKCSDILIIRHGRSRSRHSIEKSHVQWGLKALDNLTLVENHDGSLEFSEIEANNELNILNLYVNNTINTQSQSSELNGTIGSFEINFTHNPDPLKEGKKQTTNFVDWLRAERTTEIPKSTKKPNLQSSLSFSQPSKAQGAAEKYYVPTQKEQRKNSYALAGAGSDEGEKKEEIMLNIKNTVDKGIQYLKAHENLNEIKIEINDNFHAAEFNNAAKKREQHNKILRSQYIPVAIKMDKPSSSSSHLSNPASSLSVVQQQQQQQKLRKHNIKEAAAAQQAKEIKINGGKELGIVTILTSSQSRHHDDIENIFPHRHSPSPSLPPTTKQLKFHQSQRMKNRQSHIKKPNQLESSFSDVFYVPSTTEEPMLGDQPISDDLKSPTSGNGILSMSDTIESKDSHRLDKSKTSEPDRNSTSHSDTFQHDLVSSQMTDKNVVVASENVNVEEESDSGEERIQNDAEVNVEFENAYFVEDLEGEPIEVEEIEFDLDMDETSRKNRKNLKRGQDVVTQFLQIVESQHVLGGNCTAGTALLLGEGVVDRYAQDRFRVEAEVAVNRANMLTRIFKLTSPAVQTDINLLHASVLSMVDFDDDIFAGGHCFDWNQYPNKKGLFCPFAHRLPPPEDASLAKDLANEYHYLGNSSEWFFQARKNAERVIAKNEQYIKAYHSYGNDSERVSHEILSVKYEDGRWSKPYYDCGGGNIWMLTYTVPFFGYENGTYFFKGTSGIDIDLRRVDIDQCPQKNTGAAQPLNIFAGTDKCKQRTTECVPISGLGFRRGSYKCVCRRGFYFPEVLSQMKYFNGSILEEEYAKVMQSEPSSYNEENSFECLECAEGCDSCEDASPCIADLNWHLRTTILILACCIIGFLPPAAVFTFRYQQVKVVKAASPALLRVIAMGAFLIYCTTIVMFPLPSIYTCVARVWLREIGFSLTYGALMLKTWRISVIFRVRSAKAVKITDASLIKKLGLLCGFVSVLLLIRTLVSPPDVIVGRTADNLKAFLCKTDWWDHTFTSLEVLFLAWGVRLCIVVRKAPSEFNESRFISMAIYNEFLLTCFLNVSMLFLQSPANPDLLYIIFFCHTQLTVTLLLALIFGSKVYLVYRSGGKLEESMHNKSTAAKFISRSKPVAYASASSVNASSCHLPIQNGDNNKLNESEAVDEIKQLARQLQNLLDRIPQRGPTTNVILTLLEVCRTAHQQQQTTSNVVASNTLSIKSLDQKVNSICNGNGVIEAGAQTNNNAAKKICFEDKETNTSFDSLAWQQFNDANCGHKISNKCDLNTKDMCYSHKSKCCSVNNTKTTINDSTNSINFDNLQLQCMCSSDNNSMEDFQVDNCDNCCSSMQKQLSSSPCKHHHRMQSTTTADGGHSSSSFRERLLHFTSCNHSKTLDQRANNLLKRNSELVLGTNFEETLTAGEGGNSASIGGVYKSCQSHGVSCDNIFSNNKNPLASDMILMTTRHHHHNNKNNDGMNKNNKQSSCVETTTAECADVPYSFLERPTMKLSQSEDQNLRDLKIALSSTLPAANRFSNSNANPHHHHHHLHNIPSSNSNNKTSLQLNLKNTTASAPIVTQQQKQVQIQSHSCTSSSSISSKIDKISFTLSTSSVSDVQTTTTTPPSQQQQRNNIKDDDMRNMTDETHKEQQEVEARSINNQNDNKNEDNKMIMATSKNVGEVAAVTAVQAPVAVLAASSTSSSTTNVNNKHINNNGNNKTTTTSSNSSSTGVVVVAGTEDVNNGSKKRKTPESKLAIDLNDRSKYTDEVSV